MARSSLLTAFFILFAWTSDAQVDVVLQEKVEKRLSISDRVHWCEVGPAVRPPASWDEPWRCEDLVEDALALAPTDESILESGYSCTAEMLLSLAYLAPDASPDVHAQAEAAFAKCINDFRVW